MNGWTSKQVDCKERQGNKGTSGQGNGWTSKQVNCEERQSNEGTSGRVNKLIAKKDKVTGEQG